MKALPTVLILAEPQPERMGAGEPSGPLAFSTLDTTLRRVLASGLPLLLVAPQEQASAARNLLKDDDILPAPPVSGEEPARWLIRALAAGVMTRAQSPGWLFLPADMPMLQASTLQTMAQGLQDAPLAYPCHRHMRGHPMAVSSELYSELVRLDTEQDLRRLAARYPATDVAVGDPGIHLTMNPQSGLNQLRAHLTGAHLPTQHLPRG